MREIGFITLLPETFGVFIDNSNVGTIRKHGDVFQFTLGKSRKPDLAPLTTGGRGDSI